jgi:hypothetical protein
LLIFEFFRGKTLEKCLPLAKIHHFCEIEKSNQKREKRIMVDYERDLPWLSISFEM